MVLNGRPGDQVYTCKSFCQLVDTKLIDDNTCWHSTTGPTATVLYTRPAATATAFGRRLFFTAGAVGDVYRGRRRERFDCRLTVAVISRFESTCRYNYAVNQNNPCCVLKKGD